MAALLVAYDSKNGSTGEVAEFIADRLRERGQRVETVQARQAKKLAGWDGVVVGAPIYSGHWLSGGHRILKRLSKLSTEQRPRFAIFALGPRHVEGPESWSGPREQFEKALLKHPTIEPVSTALFGGMDPPKKKSRRDARDWATIQAWVDEIVHQLGE